MVKMVNLKFAYDIELKMSILTIGQIPGVMVSALPHHSPYIIERMFSNDMVAKVLLIPSLQLLIYKI